MSIITFTTDFGLQDWFVGTMKGVALNIAPDAQAIDITHEIPPGDIQAAAFALAAASPFFPPGTVHVAVVDPGVGSDRAAIAVRTDNYLFVGPDNGVLSLALMREPAMEIRRLENKAYFLQPLSRTFHGRDVFAPVGAHLSRGVPMTELGPELREYVKTALPAVRKQGSRLVGAVVYIDRFGNAITNIAHAQVAALRGSTRTIRLKAMRSVLPLVPVYSRIARGKAGGVLGSSGYLEIAINQGHAARELALKINDRVVVE